MGNLGWVEIMVVLVIALIVFGPRKLPELGKTLGNSLAQFKRASEDFKRTWESEVETEKRRLDVYQPPEPQPDYVGLQNADSQSDGAAGEAAVGEPASGEEPGTEGASEHLDVAADIAEPAAVMQAESAASPESGADTTRRDWA